MWPGVDGVASTDEKAQRSISGDKKEKSISFRRYVSSKKMPKENARELYGPFNSKGDHRPQHFTNMTSRGLTINDMQESDVIAANVFIGNKPLWHTSLDEKRFDSINKDPEILTRTKVRN